jgi:hypothetical protein
MQAPTSGPALEGKQSCSLDDLTDVALGQVLEEDSGCEINDLEEEEVESEEARKNLGNLFSSGETANTNKAYKTQKRKYMVYLKKKEDDSLLPHDLTDFKMASYVAKTWQATKKVPQYRLTRSMFHNELVNNGKPSFNSAPHLYPLLRRAYTTVMRSQEYKSYMPKKTSPLTVEQDVLIVDKLWDMYIVSQDTMALSLLVRYHLMVLCAFRSDDIDVIMGNHVQVSKLHRKLLFHLVGNKIAAPGNYTPQDTIIAINSH